MNVIKKVVEHRYFSCFYVGLLLLGLFGCQDNTSNLFPDKGEFSSQNYTRSIDDALSDLSDFLSSTSLGETRAEVSFCPELVLVVTRSKTGHTRSAVMNDSLLYLVNFEDSTGFAILSADTRVPETVLAVTDEGNISIEDFELSQELDSLDFSLYNEEDSDYYVGSAPKENSLMASFIIDYADEYINGSGGSTGNSNSGNSGNSNSSSNTWLVYKSVPPMLTTAWYQREPFNDSVRTILGGKTKAGCVAVAVGQIMAYHEFPTDLSQYIDDPTISWSDIKTVYPSYNITYGGTANGKKQVAELMKEIGQKCRMLYTSDFGFATPAAARDCMLLFGYPWTVKWDWYYESKIISMLDKGNPVFIAALEHVPAGDWLHGTWTEWEGGHAWVIDGYIQYRRYVSGTAEDCYYVHCNWGWRGRNNGYFLSGMFDTLNAASYDYSNNNTYNSVSSFFSWWFRVLSYKNPKTGL